MRDSRKSGSVMIISIFSANSVVLSGSKYRHASPPISGRLDEVEDITGHPCDIASKIDLPNCHLIGIDVTQMSSLEKIGVSDNDLTSLVLTYNVNLKQISASGNNIAVVSWPVGASEMMHIDLSDNNLTTLFLMDPALWSDGGVCTFENNSLDATSVNDVLQSADASGKLNGNLYLDSGTNAAPTGAGITAKANLITKGWSVLTN